MADAPAVRQLFKYFGSKARLAPALAECVPEGVTVLVSPFFGSGVFEYNWAAAHPDARVVGYDLDPAVVNFHRQAQARPRALYGRIMGLRSPRRGEGPLRGTLDKDEYAAMVAAGLSDGLDGAARFYVASVHSYNGKIGSYARAERFREPRALLAELPRNVTVVRGDALRVVEAIAQGRWRAGGRDKQGGLFLYLDPPYYLMRANYYRQVEFDHERLAAALRGLQSVSWLLSYNDVPEVRSLYARGTAHILTLPIHYRALHRATGDMLSVRRGELLITPRALPAQVRARVLARLAASRAGARSWSRAGQARVVQTAA